MSCLQVDVDIFDLSKKYFSKYFVSYPSKYLITITNKSLRDEVTNCRKKAYKTERYAMPKYCSA